MPGNTLRRKLLWLIAGRAAATQAVQSDGFVQDLVNLIDGKVVDSSIRQTEKP